MMKRLLDQFRMVFTLIFIGAACNLLADTYILQSSDVEMADSAIINCKLTSDSLSGKSLIIPDTLNGQSVKVISDKEQAGDGVFAERGIVSITLPKTIEYIGKHAVWNNTSLASINMDSCIYLETVAWAAFDNHSADTVDMSHCQALELIEGYAVDGDTQTVISILPDNPSTDLMWWDWNTGYYSPGDTVILATGYEYRLIDTANMVYTLQDADVVMQDSMLVSCTLEKEDLIAKQLVIPDSLDGKPVKVIAGNENHIDAIFYDCGITAVRLPAPLEKVGVHAFHSNSSLRDIDFTACENLDTLAWACFGAHNASSIDLSNCTSLAYIGRYALDCADELVDNTIIFSALPNDNTHQWYYADQGSLSASPTIKNAISETDYLLRNKYSGTYAYLRKEIVSHSITYHNVGTKNAAANPASLNNNTTLTLAPALDSTSYIFDGWYADSAFAIPVSTPAVGLLNTQDLNFYAKWIDDSSTGLANVANENMITIYPNPASEVLHIAANSTIEQCRVYDMAGKLVLSSYSENVVDISSLKPGLYHAVISEADNSQPSTVKFIIM